MFLFPWIPSMRGIAKYCFPLTITFLEIISFQEKAAEVSTIKIYRSFGKVTRKQRNQWKNSNIFFERYNLYSRKFW